jgi:RNA polymerase sigma factor (sigma-70 family)
MTADVRVDGARADRAARLGRCLELARAGALEALDPVVRELNPLLWHVARSEGLATEDAIDVVQTTWLELLRRLHDIRSPEALTAWLVATTRRAAWRTAAQRRRHPREGMDALTALPDPQPDPAELAVMDERDRTLMRHFARLPQRCQALLRMVAMVARADYDAVSEAMTMPRGSIGPTRARCLGKLRQALLADPTWGADPTHGANPSHSGARDE